MTIANTNPVIINEDGFPEVSGGEVEVWGDGEYEIRISDANGTLQYTASPIVEPFEGHFHTESEE